MVPLHFQSASTIRPGSLRAFHFIPDHGQTLFTEVGCCPNTVIARTLFRSLLHCAVYPLAARIALNFANSSRSLGGTQTCELPFRPFLLARVGAKHARRRDSRKALPALYIGLITTSFLGNRSKIDKLAIFQWLKHVHFPFWDVSLRSNRGELSLLLPGLTSRHPLSWVPGRQSLPHPQAGTNLCRNRIPLAVPFPRQARFRNSLPCMRFESFTGSPRPENGLCRSCKLCRS